MRHQDGQSATPANAGTPITRRGSLLLGASALAGSTLLSRTAPAAEPVAEFSADPFRYCLNTSTIREQQLGIVAEVELAARAGYTGIEPWIREIQQYVDEGGSLRDLKQRIADAGLTVESAIGFPAWCVDDEAQRADGIETFKRDAQLVADIGGTRIAAPPVGAHGGDAPRLDLFAVAERYAALLDIGRDIGVTPMAEIWGPSKNLSRLGEAVFVAVESNHPDACLLPDIYHIYRGGSGFEGLKLLAGDAIPVFHVNDYPGSPERTALNDRDRVFVGDGAAPTDLIFRSLAENGCRAALSLELFNPTYWKRDAEEVVVEGLRKTKHAVAKALGLA
ncbi:MAG: sugar phosphate isomerase/epimerase family protein [Planctomycetaceae bacterium]